MDIAVGSIWRSITACTEGDQTALNIRYWLASNLTGVFVEDTTWVTKLSNDLSALYIPWLGSSAAYYGTAVQQVSPSLTALVSSLAGAGPGTGGISDMGAQVSGCCTLKTQFAGRKFRGRIYPPFPGHDMTSPPFGLTGGGVSNLAAIGSYFATVQTVPEGASTIDMRPILMNNLHTINRGDIISIRPNNKLATQRRRGAYGRPNSPPF